PVDLPGNQRLGPTGPLQPPDDRDLGAAAGCEYRTKTGVLDQAEYQPDQRHALVLGPIPGVAGEISGRPVATAFDGKFRQGLQQPVDQSTALQGARARSP